MHFDAPNVIEVLEKIGELPLPPYIHRETQADSDLRRYQTVYAQHHGAVAADIVSGLRSGAHTVWSPAKLRYVFAVLRHLPRPVWRRVAASK